MQSRSGLSAVVESGFDEGVPLRAGEGQVAQLFVLGVSHVDSGLVLPGFWTLVRAAAVVALVPVTRRRSSSSRRGWLQDLLWVAGGPLERGELVPADAGMARSASPAASHRAPRPRRRGDGPPAGQLVGGFWALVPASAGVARPSRAGRFREDRVPVHPLVHPRQRKSPRPCDVVTGQGLEPLG